jgi:predicted MPP superfamily phosphohydrolase
MIQTLILPLGAIGHLVLWVALVNRAHALGIPRRWVNIMTLACIVMFAVMPVAILAALWIAAGPQPTLLTTMFYAAAWTYIIACAVVCVIAGIQRLLWRFHAERKGVLKSNHTTRINLATQLNAPVVSPGVATWLGRIPGNQIQQLHVQEKQVRLPQLSPRHEGLRIAHLTDLHMSGRMSRAYYEFVVDETNRRETDIIAITGDIVDTDDCCEWIPDVLGRLSALYGVFYVLGNHDRRVNRDQLKSALSKTGWTHVAGPPRRLTFRDLDIVLGGNEQPWYGPPTDFAGISPAADSLRIALSHSPDQIGWACANNVDLMLAGHVHGGQLCLPVIGPFTAPSMHGVRYAAGTFRVQNTVLHVSRGAASLTPLRWNCPPEIAVLHLAPTTPA